MSTRERNWFANGLDESAPGLPELHWRSDPSATSGIAHLKHPAATAQEVARADTATIDRLRLTDWHRRCHAHDPAMPSPQGYRAFSQPMGAWLLASLSVEPQGPPLPLRGCMLTFFGLCPQHETRGSSALGVLSPPTPALCRSQSIAFPE